MKILNKKTGKIGEDIATKFLEGKGYEIIKRNFANKFGEIDIIARDGVVLVFVEVKTKIGEAFGSPEEMVGKGKLNKIKRMAAIYFNGKEVPCRVDVLAVVLGAGNEISRLAHYENVTG